MPDIAQFSPMTLTAFRTRGRNSPFVSSAHDKNEPAFDDPTAPNEDLTIALFP
jgi:hypothetical protein